MIPDKMNFYSNFIKRVIELCLFGASGRRRSSFSQTVERNAKLYTESDEQPSMRMPPHFLTTFGLVMALTFDLILLQIAEPAMTYKSIHQSTTTKV